MGKVSVSVFFFSLKKKMDKSNLKKEGGWHLF